MKAVTLTTSISAVNQATTNRWADYICLARPRIAVLVLFTVGIGVLMASVPLVPWAILFHAVFGTALVATGAGALNQWLEVHTDSQMKRTANRPLPAGRLSTLEVFAFGLILGVGGVAYMMLLLPTPVSGFLAGVTFLSYVCLYTPLKRLTTLNTLVGAIPGAMPPVIGWCAVRGDVTVEAVTLFTIVFLWQIPHFLAIAWMYREEYAKAQLQMLPAVDPDGRDTARQMVLYCLALMSASLAPALLGAAGLLYIVGALALGLFFLGFGLRFMAQPCHARAKSMLRSSLVYLPGLLFLLLLDRSITVFFKNL
jgi:protoheme IX farnesyltransferase